MSVPGATSPEVPASHYTWQEDRLPKLCLGAANNDEGRRKRSPISLRLEKPAVIGACLGDLPRFGALDDHTLHPSPRDLSLETHRGTALFSEGGHFISKFVLSHPDMLLNTVRNSVCEDEAAGDHKPS